MAHNGFRRAAMSIKVFIALVFALLAATGVASAQDSDGLQERSMTFGGRTRDYLVHLPPTYDAERPTPVVLVLHGRIGNGRGAAALSGMNNVADRNGFIVIYPDGIDGEWTEHMDLVDPTAARRARAPDDVAFLTALADRLETELNADPARTYVTGFSNGGFMTLRLACERPTRFAAFAEVGAALHTVIADRCHRGAAPVLLIHGDRDPSVPYNGVAVTDPRSRPVQVMLSVPDSAEFLMRRNGCGNAGRNETLEQGDGSPQTLVHVFRAADCPPGKEIILYTIEGGGHQWPGMRALDETRFGPVNMDINASELIWQFFSAYARAP
jgi:polyhydroxybutyrate depolymerase